MYAGDIASDGMDSEAPRGWGLQFPTMPPELCGKRETERTWISCMAWVERILAGKGVLEAPGMLERVTVSHYSFSNRYRSLGVECRRMQTAE
jgi:hypothetical protein